MSTYDLKSATLINAQIDANAVLFGALHTTDTNPVLFSRAAVLGAELGFISALVRARGDIITGAAGAWQRLAIGTVGKHLHSDGTDVLWSDLITAQDGSAGTPGMAFISDPDTGFFRPTANTVGITANGVEKARIDVDGASFGAIRSDFASAPGTYYGFTLAVGPTPLFAARGTSSSPVSSGAAPIVSILRSND